MSRSKNWIVTRASEAREKEPDVTTAVVDRIEQLLMETLTKQLLSSSQLKAIANSLIGDMKQAETKP